MSLSPRRLAERLLRRFRFTAHLPARYGSRPIRMSSGNYLGALKPGEAKFQHSLLDFVDRFVESDSVVWDIGANMGTFAVPAAHTARATVAFEPDPFNLELLHVTVALNRDLALDIVPVALSNGVDIAKLAIAERGRSANSLTGAAHGTEMGGVRQHYSVIIVTIDWLLERLPAPTLVKCDAEGAEVWILEGGARLLSEIRPAIIIEMPNENAVRCAEIFKANGYLTMSATAPVTREGVVEDIHNVWDVLAIPQEKFEAWLGK
jgi:FkbM family methyltransferase